MSGFARLLPLYAFMAWTGNTLLFLFFSPVKTERTQRKKNIKFQGLKKRFPLPVLHTDVTPFTRGEIEVS